MKSKHKATGSSDVGSFKQVVVYTRVSSEEQEKEGYSIPSQEKLLRGYAGIGHFAVVREFRDVETAKRPGRPGFNEMVAFLKRTPTCRTILVEKTDRLLRNLKDYVTLDELDLEIHFVKESVVLSRDSRSSEKFMHGIKVLMAKNYIENLSEETRKGLVEKAEQGRWPTLAPLGYRNVVGPDSKKNIEPDPDVAPLVIRLFKLYATGKYAIKDVTKMILDAGLTFRRSKRKDGQLPTASIHRILRNRMYTGNFGWKGKR
jgi:DNA invertase Pin-like site-specific DNA recombinase